MTSRTMRWVLTAIELLGAVAVHLLWGGGAVLVYVVVTALVAVGFVCLVDARTPAQREPMPERWPLWSAVIDSWRRGHPQADTPGLGDARR